MVVGMLRGHYEQNDMTLNQAQEKNDAIKRDSRREMYEAAASTTRHTILQQTLFNK